MKKAVFLDRDGTINFGIPKYERVDSVDKVELLQHTLEGLKLLAELDYSVFIITNQAGLAEGLISQSEFDNINNRVLELIIPSGVSIEKTYVCPHSDGDGCICRKPQPELILQAAREFDIDLKNSWMIGDRVSDVMAGVNAGTHTILVKTGVPTVESDAADYTVPTLFEAVELLDSFERPNFSPVASRE